MHRRRFILSGLLCCPLLHAQSPGLMLANRYRTESALSAHRVSPPSHLGGEGLMQHHSDSFYFNRRSDNLLKLKQYQGAEATVVANLRGQDKYQYKRGALLEESDNGRRFRLGSGFSDQERINHH